MTPQVTDMFSRTMARLFDERDSIRNSTALQAIFGNPASGSQTIFSPDSSVVDIDIIRGNEKIAALVPRGTVSSPLGTLQKNLKEGKYTAFSRKFPLAEEEGNIGADQLLNRVAGMNPYDRQTQLDRMRILALAIHKESIRRIIRMQEVLAAQSLLTGVQDAIIGTTNTDLQYDFHRNATLTVTVGTAWSDIAAPALTDIDDMCKKIRALGRVNPDLLIAGDTSNAEMLDNTEILAKADNRRYNLVRFGEQEGLPERFNRFVEGGLIPYGKLFTPSGFILYVFTYVDGYDDDAGTFTKFIPDEKVLIGSSMARADRYFGPRERLPIDENDRNLYMNYFGINIDAPVMPIVKSAGGVIEPNAFYLDAFRSEDRKRVTLRTQAAPIFPTTQTDAWGVLNT